jgi:hypothetical protein
MFSLRVARPANWRQTLAFCLLWGALAANAGLCLLAPASDGAPAGLSAQSFGAVMVSLAYTGL